MKTWFNSNGIGRQVCRHVVGRIPAIVQAFLSLTVATFFCVPAWGDEYRAYSLKSAERLLRSNDRSEPLLRTLGGITAIAGAVYDTNANDLIIVGRADKGLPEIGLDYLVVALRSMLLYEEPPLVSIDRTPDTKSTQRQKVVFLGKIEDTGFGRDLLAADVLLKKLALGKIPSDDLGIDSYFSRFLKKSLAGSSEDVIGSRFWFKILERPAFAVQEGVFVIRELKIEVKTEVLYVVKNRKPVPVSERTVDEEGDAFARQLTDNYMKLTSLQPAIGRVKTLLDLVAIASGTKEIGPDLDLSYWLKSYSLAGLKTDRDYPLLHNQAEEQDAGGHRKQIELNGGIELEARTIRLQAGDITALKEAVIQSRTNADILVWKVPLGDWEIPDALSSVTSRSASSAHTDQSEKKNESGCSIEAQIHDAEKPAFVYEGLLLPPHSSKPTFRIFSQLLPKSALQDPGGVSMGMRIQDSSFRPSKSGPLQSLNNDALNSKPVSNSLSWPVPLNKPQNAPDGKKP